MAQALRTGYREVFERNEYANTLNKEQLKGLIVEITGLEAKDRIVQLICQTFETLKSISDFEAGLPEGRPEESERDNADPVETDRAKRNDVSGDVREFDMNLSYTINLVLPKTDDPAVFNAIFRSLRENLLKK